MANSRRWAGALDAAADRSALGWMAELRREERRYRMMGYQDAAAGARRPLVGVEPLMRDAYEAGYNERAGEGC